MAINTINHENDIFWQIRMGGEIWTKHYFPIIDHFSFTAEGQVWTLEEWLTSVVFYLLFHYTGAIGLIIFKAVAISLTFFVFMLLFNRMKVNLYLSFFLLVMSALVNTRGIWMIFPSIIEYLFLITTFYLIEEFRVKKRKYIPYILIFLSIIWVQAHGSFFLLTAITGAYWVGDIIAGIIKKRFKNYEPFGGFLECGQRRQLFGVMIVSLITPFASPNGFWTFIYPFRIAFGKFTSYVSEYQKFFNVWNWNWSDYIQSFVFILMVLLFFSFLISLKKLHPGDFIIGAFFTFLTMSAVRHEAIFALVALYVTCRYLATWFGEYRGILKRTYLKDILIIILIVFSVIYYKTYIIPFGFGFSEDGYPKYEAELINGSGLVGNMFNHYNYGGYLIWKMPKYKVFVDGRLEMYEGQVGQDYQTIDEAKPGYKELMDKYKINFAIIYITDGITEKLVGDPDWKYIYNDDQFVLFVKNEPENKEFLAKNYYPEREKTFTEVYKKRITLYKAQIYNNNGLNALKKHNVLVAMNFFQTARVLDPTNLEIRFNLANTYTQFTLYTQAELEYKEILEINPGNTAAEQGLKYIYSLRHESPIY